MSLKHKYEPPECEWCGCKMPFRGEKKYCSSSCRSYAWRNKKRKKESRKKVLGYIKRRQDVKPFSDYLKLIRRYNKLYSDSLVSSFKGKKAEYLKKTYELLKCDTPHKYSGKIDEILKKIEKSKDKC